MTEGSTHGRLYNAADDRFGAARVVVLTHPLWQDVFGARADVVGETIQLSGAGYTIVGVLPPGVDLNPAGQDFANVCAFCPCRGVIRIGREKR